ncbi:hypothetical protein [Nonomuraea guangzhouensis]|uniref:Uncharacterized protein n=1 Tax=Nonomuraea guangzhouensis TaxID=1291555 RepID=A0ABW4GZE3_9ACTN|nr:hypothetical protein [Nonomuraea guangzhouensis]
MTDIRPIRRIHHGPFIDWALHDDGYASEFLAGYQATMKWFAEGAYVAEAEELADIYLSNRPGGPNYAAGSSIYVNADSFPSLLMCMNGRDGVYERKYGQRLPVKDGKALTAEFVEDYGGDPSEWAFPARTFYINPTLPFHDGLLTAVGHLLRRT